eukprot:8370110-Pyramimonas_sp.AAC.1
MKSSPRRGRPDAGGRRRGAASGTEPRDHHTPDHAGSGNDPSDIQPRRPTLYAWGPRNSD